MIAIISINKPSLNSAKKLKSYLKDYKVDIFSKISTDDVILYNKLDEALEKAWNYKIIIPILAIGAVVRKIAPFLKDKTKDPAVIVVNLDLDKIVPILSGHLGGANSFSEILSKRLNAINFITTASEQRGILALDLFAKENNFRIKNMKYLARLSNRLINQENIKVYTIREIFNKLNSNNIILTSKDNLDEDSFIIDPIYEDNLLIFKPKVYIGIGLNKNTPLEIIKKAIFEFLDKYNLTLEDVRYFASYIKKQDEKALLEFLKEYNKDILFFDDNEINSIKEELSNSKATKFFNIKGVAEPCSILASEYKKLFVKKEIYFKQITLALSI